MVDGLRLSDFDTTISGSTLNGRIVHFQSLRFPERWVMAAKDDPVLKLRVYSERQTYDSSETQFKVPNWEFRSRGV